MGEARECSLVGCERALRRKNKIYCSASHRVKASLFRKKQRAREDRLIRRIDSLAPIERQMLFVSVAFSLIASRPRSSPKRGSPRRVPRS